MQTKPAVSQASAHPGLSRSARPSVLVASIAGRLPRLGAVAALACGLALTGGDVSAATGTFSNNTPISIPGIGDSGPGAPYPSTVNVSGFTGTITKLTLSLTGLTHAYPEDLNLLLVGPGGQTVLFMSDAGGLFDINGVNLTLGDAAAARGLPSQIVSGTYRPTNLGSMDPFSSPAPADLRLDAGRVQWD